MRSNKRTLVSLFCGLICAGSSSFISLGKDKAKDLSTDEIKETLQQAQITESDNSSTITNPKTKLKMSEKLQKEHVFHRIMFGDTLSKLSQRYYGSAADDAWEIIAKYPANSKVVRDGGNTIRENDILYIPQPKGVDWILFNPPSNLKTFLSISSECYGSPEWARLLQEINNSYCDEIYDDIIKLPKKITSGSYVTKSSDLSFSSLCHDLLGSYDHIQELADFNHIDPSKPLSSGKIIYIPSKFLSNSPKK